MFNANLCQKNVVCFVLFCISHNNVPDVAGSLMRLPAAVKHCQTSFPDWTGYESGRPAAAEPALFRGGGERDRGQGCQGDGDGEGPLRAQLHVDRWPNPHNRSPCATLYPDYECCCPSQACSSDTRPTTAPRCLCCALTRSWSRRWRTTRCSCRTSWRPSTSPTSWTRCPRGRASCRWRTRSSAFGSRCSARGRTWRASSSALKTSARRCLRWQRWATQSVLSLCGSEPAKSCGF